MNGKYIEWHMNGVKKFEGEWKEDKKNGKYTEWDNDGKKIKEEEWKDGEMIKDYLAPAK